MNSLTVPPSGEPGSRLEEMKGFIKNYFEDFVNRVKSEALVNFSGS